jgi:hypothetical protein
MCGIAGEIRFDESAASVTRVSAMAERLAPRGPDAAGLFRQGRVALGHRRLRIIDLSERAQQPMVDPALGLAVVYNGAIYNYRELRRDLEAKGYRFFSDGDTEVILKAVHAWGPAAVERLSGMFAFAVWERDSGRVMLARDRLGIKPLYYADTPGGFRFASTLPALLTAADVDRDIDPVALDLYMNFHAVVPAPRTILKGVRKLAPATVMTLERDGRRSEHSYWSLAFGPREEDHGLDEAAWQERVLDALRGLEPHRRADCRSRPERSEYLLRRLRIRRRRRRRRVRLFGYRCRTVRHHAPQDPGRQCVSPGTVPARLHRRHVGAHGQPRRHRLLSPLRRGVEARQGGAVRTGRRRGVRRLSLVSADDGIERRGRRLRARVLRPRA